MKPSNPTYTLKEVGLIEDKPIKKGFFDLLFIPFMEEFLYDYRQHILFSLLNPEE